jgi:hypothetical protein
MLVTADDFPFSGLDEVGEQIADPDDIGVGCKFGPGVAVALQAGGVVVPIGGLHASVTEEEMGAHTEKETLV